jgi:hypothetical protein
VDDDVCHCGDSISRPKILYGCFHCCRSIKQSLVDEKLYKGDRGTLH